MKQIKGKSEKIVIVGAGLGGLSAALRLAGAGRDVTILERESYPGGRAGILYKSGYSFDTGPTVLTMPSLINDALNCVGEELKDWLELILQFLRRASCDKAWWSDASSLHQVTSRQTPVGIRPSPTRHASPIRQRGAGVHYMV